MGGRIRRKQSSTRESVGRCAGSTLAAGARSGIPFRARSISFERVSPRRAMLFTRYLPAIALMEQGAGRGRPTFAAGTILQTEPRTWKLPAAPYGRAKD